MVLRGRLSSLTELYCTLTPVRRSLSDRTLRRGYLKISHVPQLQRLMVGAQRLSELREPEKLSNLLKEDKVDDCLSCRLIGASFWNYSYY